MADPYILGISAFYHDAAAALLQGGRIVAAAQEERFTRRKNDERFPIEAIRFCLAQAGIAAGALQAVVFYDKPIVKFTRILESFLAVAPRGARQFVRALPSWFAGKLDLRQTIRAALPGLDATCPLLFTAHHHAHAASAFYPSPFADAAVVTVDGVGEWATTTIGFGRENRLELLEELRFPHSLGLLYSAFTAYCGFRINSGEYKLMGLAPYGEPRYADVIRDRLIALRDDGSFRLNLEYFDFLHADRMTNDAFAALFDGPPRAAEAPITARHCDVARSIQTVVEQAMLNLARRARALTGSRNLCLAGGVALNGVANGRILESGIFDRLWIQPAAGDAGGALGAAFAAWHEHFHGGRPAPSGDQMQHALLGPEFTPAEITAQLAAAGAVFEILDDDALLDRVAALLASEHVVGWVQGRMEFGPRALGNRSILGDPRSPRLQSVMNQKIKFRESFRPFAPSVLHDRASEFFELAGDSPYMLLVVPVRASHRQPPPAGRQGLERRHHPHSSLPAVTHVDYSARIQTVDPGHGRFHALLRRFEGLTGCPALINTSFNVRGEPIVCSPADAYRCFVHTNMDYLAIGNHLLCRRDQPAPAAAAPAYAPD